MTARLALLMLTLSIGYGLLPQSPESARSAPAAASTAARESDVELYRAIVERMRADEGFYAATGALQHQRRYPTTPF